MRSAGSHPGAALFVLGAVFAGINAWAHITGAYAHVWWVDILAHGVFGAWFALALVRWRAWGAAGALAAVFVAGAAWELLEFAFDIWYAIPNGAGLAQHGADDTTLDMIMNMLGGLLSLRLFSKRAVQSKL